MLPPAVVLAGGFGTRLSSVISDVPKPMAPVRGRPFLEFLLGHVARQGVRRVILSVGYKREVIQDHFGSAWGGLDIDYCVEDQPLGTGGGIKKAFEDHGLARAFVFNGDSYCPVALEPLLARHRERESLLTLTLTQVADAGRFGSVEIDAENRIRAFREKDSNGGPGLINAGIYVVESGVFAGFAERPRFSFETDVMQGLYTDSPMRGFVTGAMFIDIGIPSELERAQELLS